MQSVTFNTAAQGRTTWARALALVSVAATAWALSASPAQARNNDDVYWSVGVTSPGVVVGVGNTPPPRPVVVYPQPVVVHQPVPVVVQQPYPYGHPVVVHPRPVVYQGWGHGPRWDDRHDRRRWKHHRHDHHDHAHQDRYDRWDEGDRRGGGEHRR